MPRYTQRRSRKRTRRTKRMKRKGKRASYSQIVKNLGGGMIQPVTIKYDQHEHLVSLPDRCYLWGQENWGKMTPMQSYAFIAKFFAQDNLSAKNAFLGRGNESGDLSQVAHDGPDKAYIRSFSQLYVLKNNGPAKANVKIYEFRYKSKKDINTTDSIWSTANTQYPNVCPVGVGAGRILHDLVLGNTVQENQFDSIFEDTNMYQSTPANLGTGDLCQLFNPTASASTVPIAIKYPISFDPVKQVIGIRDLYRIRTKKIQLMGGKSFTFKASMPPRYVLASDMANSISATLSLVTARFPRNGDTFYMFELTGSLGHDNPEDPSIAVDDIYAGTDYSGTSIDTGYRAGIMGCEVDVSCYTTVKTYVGREPTVATRPVTLKFQNNALQGLFRAPPESAERGWAPEGPINYDVITGAAVADPNNAGV